MIDYANVREDTGANQLLVCWGCSSVELKLSMPGNALTWANWDIWSV